VGDLLEPKSPQWVRRTPDEDVNEDRVLMLVDRLMSAFTEEMRDEVDSMVVHMAALRLLQKTLVKSYAAAMGAESAKALLAMSAEMADSYIMLDSEGREL
jgi:hypothetical protein